MPSVTFEWTTHPERSKTGVCPICKALHGHTWTFTTPEPFPDKLIANGMVVWSMGQGSRAHGHQRFNCHCTLDIVKVDTKDVDVWVEKKTRELEALRQ